MELHHRQRMVSMLILAGGGFSSMVAGVVVLLKSGALVPAMLLLATAAFCLAFIAPLGSQQTVTFKEATSAMPKLIASRKDNNPP